MNKKTTKFLSIVWLLLLTLVSVTAIAEWTDRERVIQSEINPCLVEGPDCYVYHHSKEDTFRLKKEADIIQREGNGKIIRQTETEGNHVLTINTLDKTIVLQNKHLGSEGLQRYLYLGFYEAVNYHLVALLGWEYMAYILISGQTGNQYTFYSTAPVLSPDKKRFLFVSADEMRNAYSAIAIWTILPGSLVEEYVYYPEGYAIYRLLDWPNEHTIHIESYRDTFKKEGYCSDARRSNTDRTGRVTTFEILARENGEWRLNKEKAKN